MKRNLDKPILNINGDPVTQEGQTFTYHWLIGQALHNVNDQCAGDEKYKRYQLSVRLEMAHAAGEWAELSVDDCARIKDVVGKAYGPLVVGRIFDMLDEKPELNVVKKESA